MGGTCQVSTYFSHVWYSLFVFFGTHSRHFPTKVKSEGDVNQNFYVTPVHFVTPLLFPHRI